MTSYATIDEIRDSSPNIPAIVRGSDEDILRWAHEAFVTINAHCRTSFLFEQQSERTLEMGAYADLFLPKTLSGDLSVSRSTSGSSSSVSLLDVETSPNSYLFRYSGSRPTGLGVRPSYITITGDWGYAPNQTYLLITMANQLKRNYTAHIENVDAHSSADVDNTIGQPDASDLDSAIDLLNDIKEQLTYHCEDQAIHTILPAPVVLFAATDEASATTLASALKTVFNAHVLSSVWHTVADSDNVVSISVNNPILPPEIMLAFTKVVGRVAIRDNAEDIRYQNAGFDSESFGDGYSYRVSEARAHLITPSEMALLNEHVNEGRVVY